MSTLPPPMILPPRRRRFGWLRTLIVFFAGLIAGAALCLIVVVHRVEYAIHHPENAPPRITKYLSRKLDLSTTQQDQVLAIVKQRQLALQAIRRDLQPKLNGQLDELKSQLDAVLNPEQQTKLETIFIDFKDHWMPEPPQATQPVEKQ